MKTLLKLILLTLILSTGSYAQKYITKNGHISFYSSTPMEDIEAHNRQVNAALDTKTGDLVFKVLIKSFEFKKALMQEHFNENYLESHKYPNSTFQGKITNPEDVDFGKEGKYEAWLEGKLSIHGVTKNVKEKGTFEIKEGVIFGTATFDVMVEDYDIEIPGAVISSISEVIEVRVDIKLEPLSPPK